MKKQSGQASLCKSLTQSFSNTAASSARRCVDGPAAKLWAPATIAHIADLRHAHTPMLTCCKQLLVHGTSGGQANLESLASSPHISAPLFWKRAAFFHCPAQAILDPLFSYDVIPIEIDEVCLAQAHSGSHSDAEAMQALCVVKPTSKFIALWSSQHLWSLHSFI